MTSSPVCADDRPAGLVEGLDPGAESAALELAGVDRAASGQPPTNALTTSVPPLTEASHTSRLTAS